jgi:hypothetical protein
LALEEQVLISMVGIHGPDRFLGTTLRRLPSTSGAEG